MIKVKLTQNYTGFNIEGTFDDLYELYDNIIQRNSICMHQILSVGSRL